MSALTGRSYRISITLYTAMICLMKDLAFAPLLRRRESIGLFGDNSGSLIAHELTYAVGVRAVPQWK